MVEATINLFITNLSTHSTKYKILYSFAIMLLSSSFYFFANNKIPLIDNNADNYFYKTSQQALATYATSRGLNAVLSTIEEMGLSFPIFGEVPVGNLIEPIDDLTERLSTIMLYSISSLGLQKIIMEISVAYAFKLISFCIFFILVCLWFTKFNTIVSNIVFKAIIILMILRFFLPLSSLVNNLIQEEFFNAQIEVNIQVLSSVSNKNPTKKSNIESIFSVTYANEIKEKAHKIISNGKEIVNALIQLTILYVSSFIIQALVIPLLSLYILLKLFDKIILNKNQHYLFSEKNTNLPIEKDIK